MASSVSELTQLSSPFLLRVTETASGGDVDPTNLRYYSVKLYVYLACTDNPMCVPGEYLDISHMYSKNTSTM